MNYWSLMNICEIEFDSNKEGVKIFFVYDSVQEPI
jgi:hypothetical protein